MANEASINSSLSIQVANGTTLPPLIHTKSFSFPADVTVFRGPTPGIVLATITGVQISLVLLTRPGLCTMQNLSSLYRVIVGIKDTSSGFFEPVLEFRPGEGFPMRLSTLLGTELTGGSGTGTAGSGGVLWAKGVGGSAYFDVQAFEDASV